MKIKIPEGRKGKGRPRKSLNGVIIEDLKVVGLVEDMAQDRKLWWYRINVLDHRGTTSYLSFGWSRVRLVMIFSYVVFVCR